MRREKRLEKLSQDKINIPEWLFKGEYKAIKNKIRKNYKSKPLTQIARDNIKLD